jgi:hypothetical protein
MCSGALRDSSVDGRLDTGTSRLMHLMQPVQNANPDLILIPATSDIVASNPISSSGEVGREGEREEA